MVTWEIDEGALVTDWTKVPVEEVARGNRRQMVVGENVTICRSTFDPFVVTDVHSHPHEKMTLVIKGKAKFTIDGLAVIVAPGDVLRFPPNNVHAAMMLDEEVTLIDVFSPIREDTLETPVDAQSTVSTNGKGR